MSSEKEEREGREREGREREGREREGRGGRGRGEGGRERERGEDGEEGLPLLSLAQFGVSQGEGER